MTVYTFNLRDDVFWTDKNEFSAQCTAHDFVFAFQRLFNPAVKSHNSEEYFSILNSREIREGIKPLDELGVVALSDFILEITLEQPNSSFPVLLTAPPAFPCNEEFYILASGRYGLNENAIAANGGFFLREWVYDPHWIYENRIILRRHEQNSESERVEPRGIDFHMDREGSGLTRFMAGQTDGLVISGARVDDLIRRGFPYAGTETSVWGLVFNEERAFSDKNLRLGLAHAIDRDALDFENTGYRVTSAVIPDGLKAGDVFYRDFVRDSGGSIAALEADFSKAVSLFNSAETAVNTPVVIVPAASENDAIATLIRSITQQWQEKLSLFCTIELLSPNEYFQRIANGNYDIAVMRITADYNSPTAIFAELGKEVTDKADFIQAENEIIESAEFIPLCFMKEYFFMSRRSVDLVYNPFTGAVDFRKAKRF
jgi:oligopeptide transport system substrate-binding protein